MNNFKIIYISYDGMTDPLGQSQVLPYLIGLSNFNIEIHLISFEKPEKFAAKKSTIELVIANTSIKWHPLKYHQSPPVLSTLYDVWQLYRKSNQILDKHTISIVHCRSYISSLVGLSIKKRKGIPFIFDMRGFWADERIDGKIWKLNNPVFKLIYTFFKRKEKQFILASNYIVSLTANAKDEIRSWNLNAGKQLRIKVIPCCADLDHFSVKNINPQQLLNHKNQLGISNEDFVISYVGSLGTWYMIDEMMDFIRVAVAKIPACKFLIITADDPEIATVAAKKKDISLDKIIITKAERKEVPYLIALSKFSMFFIQPSYSKKASSPTKLAEILGMGIPVICNSNVGDVEKIVQDGQVGFIVADFTPQSYGEAIDRMLNTLPPDGNRISKYAAEYASLEDGIKKYYAVYLAVLNPTHDDTIPL